MRSVAVTLFVGALVVAALISRREVGTAADRLAQARERTVTAAVQRLRKGFEFDRDKRSTQVRILAGDAALRGGLATNEATVKDQVDEEGLRVLRTFPIVVIGREDLATPLYARGLEQIPADRIPAHPALQEAQRTQGARAEAGGFVLPNGLGLFSAAGVVSLDGQQHGFLALGEILGQKQLSELATDLDATLVVASGPRALWHAGPDDAGLEPLLGHDADYVDATHVDPTGALATRAFPIVPGTVLWLRVDLSKEAAELDRGLRLTLTFVWALCLALGGAGAFLAWRRGRKPAEPLPAAPAGTSDLDLWAHAPLPPPAGYSPPGGSVVVPVVLPNGQIGQLITPSTPGVTLPRALPLAPPGYTPPGNDASIFGRYRLLERLGSGGMAEVWIAVAYGAEGFQRAFVVKRVRRDLSTNTDLVQQFIDEANLAAQLVHGNVVPVFDFGHLNGEYYLAQEYILGRDLGKVVAALATRGERLPAPLALYVLAETLKALDYAHTLADKDGKALGIVHRDVSPNNVLIGARGEVKLIDFGIAKSASKLSQTDIGTVKGNIRFMAPEQARGEVTDPRSDVFSLGATLYYTLAGEPLYTGSNQYELLLAAAAGPPVAALDGVLALPPPLGKVLARALQPLRDDRWASAQAFLEHIAPAVPVDGARRLATLMQELFGDELRAQDQNLAAAARQAPGSDDQTLQRPGLPPPQGIS